MLLEDVTASDTDNNPARRLVIGSPILNHIKYCEGIFDKPPKRNPVMPKAESPLFVPKKKRTKSVPRTESGHSSMEERTSALNEPYTSVTSRDPYENVVITSRPYTCNYNQQQFYKYTPKPGAHHGATHPHVQRTAPTSIQYPHHVPTRLHEPRALRNHYEDHVLYSAQHQSYVSYYPQREYVRYAPQRTVPPTPVHYLAPPQYPPRTKMTPSPGFDTTTSGYSSSYCEQKTMLGYDNDSKTHSLNRGPSLPTLNRGPSLPAMSEEDVLSQTPQHVLMRGATLPGTMPHQKFILDRSILRQYFCIALSACIMCPPCGYWALYQAFKVDDMVDNGNYLGAERLARKIKRYSIVMFCVGLFWVSLTIGIFVLLLNKFKN